MKKPVHNNVQNEVKKYVEKNIDNFHKRQLEKLSKLKLKTLLKRKNPYLFRAKDISAKEMVEGLLVAHASSSEETTFGDWLEELAIFVNKKVYGGWKSGIEGIDLEFDKNGKRCLVAIKSGPNWGNSSQIKKMRENFIKAKQTLRTSNSKLEIVAVNGCCYGRNRKPDKGDYFKYCGKDFWEFISGDSELFVKIIQPLGHRAKEENETFKKSYKKVADGFTKEFKKEFCFSNGGIDWEKLIRFNSE